MAIQQNITHQEINQLDPQKNQSQRERERERNRKVGFMCCFWCQSNWALVDILAREKREESENGTCVCERGKGKVALQVSLLNNWGFWCWWLKKPEVNLQVTGYLNTHTHPHNLERLVSVSIHLSLSLLLIVRKTDEVNELKGILFPSHFIKFLRYSLKLYIRIFFHSYVCKLKGNADHCNIKWLKVKKNRKTFFYFFLSRLNWCSSV